MTLHTAQTVQKSDPHITAVAGDPNRQISGVASLSSAGAGKLTFISRPFDEALLQAVRGPLAGATIICAACPDIDEPGVTFLLSTNPRLSFMRAVGRFFAPEPAPSGVHPTAVVHETATVSPSAHIGPGVVVGQGSSVGDGSVLHPNVVLYANVKVGKRVVIHAGTVIGADGFGYERNEDGELEKFPHIGGVTILDDAEIGSNTSIDRGALSDTVIGKRARVDNQVHIAHNVIVGQDVAVIAQAMIGGSVRIGDRAWIAPSATIMNKADIGADATVGLGAVVVRTVADGQTVMGSPAVPDQEFRAVRAALKRLVAS